jgi:hypothetical protein
VLHGGRTQDAFVAGRFHSPVKRIKVSARRGVETGSMRESLFRVLAAMGALALGSLVASCVGDAPFGANFVPEPSYKPYTPIIGPILGGETTTVPTPGLKPLVGVAPFVTGNDTGGIIQWTPYVSRIYRRWAADHCAQWHRIATITSVHRRYGDYVAFTCDVDRRYDPRKASWWHHG